MPGANLTRIEAEERKSIIAAPIHYTVKLDLTRGAKDFGSETTITFDAKPGESSFLDLIANEVSEITLNGETLDPAEAYVDSRIELKGLKEHNEVTVKAMCQYSNTGEGLHRSVDPSDGNVYLYTQFEVPDARRVYAVFDQPDLKAVFDFSVLAAKSWIVTSNMPTSSVTDNETVTEEGTLGDHAAETTKLWVFELTPTMSSYLTAICAGPYAEWHTEYANEDGRTVPMAMYCRQALAKAFSKDVDYLFDITKKGFAFYAKTWGVPYPYAKFDQIYVPEYNAGAMENIGMVTIRDQYVFESKVTDAYAERRVVTVLHELAHMWFGDYVTMKWWNDLWVYYVGREKFFKGINNYLNKHAYSNATLADLLAELELTSGRDLKAWSAQWLEESGINTIATEVEENEDGTIKRLALRQTAPAEHPVLRAHRLAVGFYNEDPETGKIVRTDRFELDVDGELTVVDAAAGKARPSLILVNDDDLTYTKLRFDDKSLAFATSNLYRFDDALARSVIWLALWDMTRDGELPARQFIDTSLAALATEHESTTFRYALAQVSTTAWHYTAPAERAEIVKHVAAELFKLAGQAKAGSDEQFQLVTAYLGYGEPGDEAFVANAKGLLDGSVAFDGLEIDNNFRWTIINALSTVNAIDQAGIDAELAKRETTENREFAYGARAVAGTAEAKAWAWNEALHNDELTNMQLEAVAGGFAATPRADLAEPYAEKYFEVADWIWEHKTFHMAEALLEGLYPGYADPAKLVELGDAWLASHKDADNALQRIVRGNVEASHRTLKVRDFNAAL